VNTSGRTWSETISRRSERYWEEVNTLPLGEVEVKSYVGGLVKSFERKAA
jgi:hypothetical protein